MDEDWGYVRRSRKPVDRFVAVPASYRTPGDFVKPEKVEKVEKIPKSTGKTRGRPRKTEVGLKSRQIHNEELEPLRCRPEDMLGKTVKVFWEAERQHFLGEVRSYEPSLQHPFTIVYEDEDTEDGVFYENFFVNDEDVKRPYEVVGEGIEGEKPAAMRKSATNVKATVEHGSAAARESAPQPKLTVEQRSAAAKETAPQPKARVSQQQPAAARKVAPEPKAIVGQKPKVTVEQRSAAANETAPQPMATVSQQQPAAARKVAPEPKAIVEHKPVAQGLLKMPAPAMVQRPAPVQTPGSRPSSASLTNPTPQRPLLTPGVLSKFQQAMQKHTSGAARNATSPSTPDHAGIQRKPVPASGLVMGIPVPGSRGPVGQSYQAGLSTTASTAVTVQGQLSAASTPMPNQRNPPTPAPACSAMPIGMSPSVGPATQPRRPVNKLDSLIPDWQATRHAPVVRAQASPGHSSALPKQAQQPVGAVQGPPTVLAQQGTREAGTANGRATEVAGSPASLQDPARPGPACAAPSRLAASTSPAHTAGKDSAVSRAEVTAPAREAATGDAPQRKRGRLPKDADPDPPPAKKRGRPRKVADAEVQQQDEAADDARMEDGGKGATQQAATNGKRGPKNGYGPLAADADPSPAPRPEGQQAVSAGKQATPPEETTKVKSPLPAPTAAGVSSPVPMQQRPLSGGAPASTSPSSLAAAYDARAAAQPLRKAGTAASAPASRAPSKLRPQATSASMRSPAARAEASPAQLPSPQQVQTVPAAAASMRSPAVRAEASPAQLPSRQQDQGEPAAAAERDPWSVSPPSTGGVAPNGGVRSPVMGYSSPGLQPAKAAAHPQVTKLVTMLPSKLSPAYTPSSVRQTPGGSSAKRSSFGGSRDAASRGLGIDDGPGADEGPSHDEDAEEKAKEDLEVAKRRKAQESIMRKVEAAMKGLTRNKDSIKAATLLLTQAAHRDAAPRVMRLLMQHMEKEEAGSRRVDLLYLTDSVLQNCRNAKNSGCGPDSAPGQAYPRVIAAALPALIRCVAEDSEGAFKADKVLKLWAKRDLLPSTSLQPEIERLQEHLLQHSAANAAKAATDSLLSQAHDIMGNGSNSGIRIGSEAGGAALMELKEEEDDDWDDDQAAPLPTLPQKQEEHRAPWQHTGGTDVAVGAAPDSPEGSPWHHGVSPASSGYAPWSPLSSAEGQGTPQHVPAALAAAPWNQPAAAAPPGLGPTVAAHGQDQYSAYRMTPAVAAAFAAPPPQPPSALQSWPHAQQQSAQQLLLPGHNGDAAATAAPQPIAWEPEESWDSDADAVPPGLSDTPKNSRGRQPWRQGSLDRFNSPDSQPPRNGSAPGPSRLSAAAAAEPARLLDEYDDLYNTAQPAVVAGQLRQPSRSLPAPIVLPPPPLFPQPCVLTPPAHAVAPLQYALHTVPQEYGELPPLPEDDPPPLPDAPPPEIEDDENFQPPLPDEPPPPMPLTDPTAVRRVTDMDVDMDMEDAGIS